MIDYAKKIEEAIIQGEWTTVSDTAEAWVCAAGLKHDPRPYFALNVVQLLGVNIGAAWQTHERSLQDAAHIEAVKGWVDALVTDHPANASIHLIAGLFLAQSGQSEQSVLHYKEAIRLDPGASHPHYFLAQIHERADRMDMAIREYREAVKLDPMYTAARTNLGVAYQQQGQFEMAIPQYREVIKQNPDDPLAHANLASALAEQGKLEAAIMEYKEALKLNPRMRKHTLPSAISIIKKIASILRSKRIGPLWKPIQVLLPAETALGWILFDGGNKQEAMERFNRASRAIPMTRKRISGSLESMQNATNRKPPSNSTPKLSSLKKTPIKKAPLCRMRIRQAAPGISSKR